MSLNKIIVVFGLLLIAFGAFVFFQFNNKYSALKPNGSVTIGTHTFDVEVVKSSKDEEIGLTKYRSIKEAQGMLFFFTQPSSPTFWMKNMKFPIDIIFINNNTIVSFVQNVPAQLPTTQNPPLYQPEGASNYVLEINAGLVKKYNIKKGDNVTIKR
ncbi:MAG TPA: DUF192 domain-containing protein [Methylomirabilota bacterium]|nr:DUF192 domain-containing protein [Methylomirabilota bacterium]